MLSSETKSGELTQSTSQSVAQFSDSFQENFLKRIGQLPNSSSLTYKQTNFADGRIERVVTIKPITAVDRILRSIAITVILIILMGFSVITHELYHDYHAERDIQLMNATVEITICRDDFYTNLCQPETKVPSTEEFCNIKQKCMLQNPHSLARQQMSLQVVLSKSFIAFFDVLSYKSFGFLLAFSLLLAYVVISVLKQ